MAPWRKPSKPTLTLRLPAETVRLMRLEAAAYGVSVSVFVGMLWLAYRRGDLVLPMSIDKAGERAVA
jgi:hypothetical protein